MHPDLETLLRCRHAELPTAGESRVRDHLLACDDCRLEFHRLQRVLARRPSHPPDDFVLSGLRQRIRNWESERASGNWMQGVKTRVLRQLGPFLGSQGADSLLEPVAQDGGNLLSTIEPVLAEFLGNRAASNLVGRVVDSAL